jgi:hypothetical protein
MGIGATLGTSAWNSAIAVLLARGTGCWRGIAALGHRSLGQGLLGSWGLGADGLVQQFPPDDPARQAAGATAFPARARQGGYIYVAE